MFCHSACYFSMMTQNQTVISTWWNRHHQYVCQTLWVGHEQTVVKPNLTLWVRHKQTVVKPDTMSQTWTVIKPKLTLWVRHEQTVIKPNQTLSNEACAVRHNQKLKESFWCWNVSGFLWSVLLTFSLFHFEWPIETKNCVTVGLAGTHDRNFKRVILSDTFCLIIFRFCTQYLLSFTNLCQGEFKTS